jgi:hypothetical protein
MKIDGVSSLSKSSGLLYSIDKHARIFLVGTSFHYSNFRQLPVFALNQGFQDVISRALFIL